MRRTFIDTHAAEKLAELREDAGFSQEGFAKALRAKAEEEGWSKVYGAVDAFTIRAIEDYSHVPGARVRLLIALFLEVQPRDIWVPANRYPAAKSLRARMAARREAREEIAA